MRKLLATIVLLCGAGAAAAEPPPIYTGTNTNRPTSQPSYSAGNVGRDQMDVQPAEEALAVGRNMARCEVSRHPNQVKTVLDMPNADEFRRVSRKLYESMADCMAYGGKNLADVSHMELGSSALAGLLAEAMLARSGVVELAPQKYDANAPRLDPMAESQASLVQLRLAECLTYLQPAQVAAIVRAAPKSNAEQTAFSNLVPAIPTCLDKNVTLKATRSSLRLALAFALYRRTLAPASAGSGR